MNWCILTALRSRIILSQIIQSFSLIIITLPPKFVIFNYFTNTLTREKNPDFKTSKYQTTCFEWHNSIFRLKQIV